MLNNNNLQKVNIMKILLAVLLVLLIPTETQAHEWLSDFLAAEYDESFEYEIISEEEFLPYEESQNCRTWKADPQIGEKVRWRPLEVSFARVGGGEETGGSGGCDEFDHLIRSKMAAIMKCAGLPIDFENIIADPHAYLDEHVSDIETLIDSPFPIYVGPETFIEGYMTGEHGLYRLSEGLKFNCVQRVDESGASGSY